MVLRRYCRFCVDFESKWIQLSGALVGLSFFLRIVYYFALMSLRDVSLVELIISTVFGILLCIAYVVCLNCLHRNAPGLYGIIGTAQCIMMIVISFTTADPVRIVLAIVWYALTALVMLATVGGYLPGRLLSALMFGVAIVVRVFFYGIGQLGIRRGVQEIAVICVLGGMACLCMGLKKITLRNRS